MMIGRVDNRLYHVAARLGSLRERAVFFGAAVVSVLVTDTGAASDRPTTSMHWCRQLPLLTAHISRIRFDLWDSAIVSMKVRRRADG
jgi:hypothetical protein